MAVVGNNKFGRTCSDGDVAIAIALTNTLHGILDDVDKHLLEEDGVKVNGDGFFGQKELYTDVR